MEEPDFLTYLTNHSAVLLPNLGPLPDLNEELGDSGVSKRSNLSSMLDFAVFSSDGLRFTRIPLYLHMH